MKKSGVWEQMVGESHDLRHRSLINKSQSAPTGYFQIAEIRKAPIKVEALMPIVNLPSVNKIVFDRSSPVSCLQTWK